MTTTRLEKLAVLTALWLLGVSCSGMKATRFTNPRFDFGYVEKVAVLPLENLSNDQQAGERATRILITELLASGAVDVVEPGELRAVQQRLPGSPTTPSKENLVSIGQSLEVQAVILGSVTQSETVRSGTTSIPVVTLDLHLVETETGAPVWAATHTEKGSGLSAKLLGTGSEPISETTRRCVRRALKSLVR